MASTTFESPQLVRVDDYRSAAHGRYGRILKQITDSSFEVEFADLLGIPALAPPSCAFERSQLKVVEGVPDACFYLLVTVTTLVGTQEHTRYTIAHGQVSESTHDVAETIAAKFFGSLGDWDGEYYLWTNTPCAAKLETFELITAADYASLRRTTPDYELGSDVSGDPF